MTQQSSLPSSIEHALGGGRGRGQFVILSLSAGFQLKIGGDKVKVARETK